MSKYRELGEVIRTLPPVGLREPANFGYLQYTHRLELSGPVVKLGGLWADIDFDVTDEDVRNLRQHVSRQLADRV